MIDPKELRLGNWVEDGKGYKRIYQLDFEQWSFDYYNPIPLTPEILEKAGLVKSSDYYSQRIDEYIWLYIYNDGTYGFFSDSKDYDGEIRSQDNRIEYVHQLQNLVFALTGEELTIDL